MPIGEIAGELVGPVLRFVAHIFIDLILEALVRGAGYMICRPFFKSSDPTGGLVLFVGILFWLALFVIGVFSYSSIEMNLAVDSCLDSGGSFDYQRERCEH